ncbi:2-phospho-L-lactate guanylyltransferase [Nocardioides pocheonensis]|uniref:Phosphoenolpyruvate guanylyltransferase n=1 Tax=Nocardioides pocheonensis TaxID=661485 RepID=A0A3N0GUN1_9ACTN|nr:2-phospho-L-lactate guanylyltransferase [Nocardioides pocheonensis]RNM16167.1 2-phospho-L-lactate guanylyltransferase [Nocardioides pocheonensis]
MTTPRFTLLIPIKDGREAKTRLDAVGAVGRAELMAAFARDAVTAALRTPLVRVHVVGDRTALEPVLAGLDVTVVPDEGAGDLNRALTHAARAVAEPARGTAVMLADLPCLRSEDLEAALTAAPFDRRSFVADAAGTGTTLLVAPPGTALDPRFGPDSARAHADGGAAAITADLASLRLDVDTTADLQRALQFGVGPHTAAAAAGLGHLAGS